MSSRVCAAMIAQMAFADQSAERERKQVRNANKPRRKTRRSRRSPAD